MNTTKDTPITWQIKEGPGTGYNDKITTVTHPQMAVPPQPGKYDVEEDGYPVVVMETGVDSDGEPTYHEQREITGPAKTWEEAKGQVRLADDEEITEEGLSGLQSGSCGEVDYYAVEVLTPKGEE